MLAQFFLAPAYLPFAVALAVMIGIGLIEAVGLGLGHLDLDGHGAPGAESAGGVLDWLGLGGELPILIWLTSLLGCFAVAGVAIQQGATAVVGAPLGWGLASGVALVTGAFLNAFAANGLARVMPGYETTVISADDLMRYRGTILEGTARRGAPARAKVVDRHGQAHFVMVEPHDDGDVLVSGETALLVRREGRLFFAQPEGSTIFKPV